MERFLAAAVPDFQLATLPAAGAPKPRAGL
jgi:hypothetical protein